MKRIRKIITTIRESVSDLNFKISNYIQTSQNAITDTKAEAYVGEAVKILIAVVIGALLLTLTYTLMKDTVFESVTTKITEMFAFKK